MADENEQFANILASYNSIQMQEIISALINLSAVVAQYYKCLISEGIPDDKAVILAGSFQNIILSSKPPETK